MTLKVNRRGRPRKLGSRYAGSGSLIHGAKPQSQLCPSRAVKLYIGKQYTGVAVQPDEHWVGMYRVHWPDQPPSVMVNLSRAKDAAMRWVGRAGGAQGRQLNWKHTQRPG